jgi:hypothetical protein
MAAGERIALGFRAHSGWAAAVAVTKSRGKFVVLERRRIVTADGTLAGSKQPFHAAERLDFDEAAAHIQTCRERSTALAIGAVSGLIAHRPVCAAILCASGRALPELAAILRSHALIHTAEGEFFRDILAIACEGCALPVIRVKEREIWDRAAIAMRRDAAEVIRDLGATLGPPWTQDEKLASLAAWIALAEAS